MASFSVIVPPRLANAICGPVVSVLYIDNYSLNKNLKVLVQLSDVCVGNKQVYSIVPRCLHSPKRALGYKITSL